MCHRRQRHDLEGERDKTVSHSPRHKSRQLRPTFTEQESEGVLDFHLNRMALSVCRGIKFNNQNFMECETELATKFH